MVLKIPGKKYIIRKLNLIKSYFYNNKSLILLYHRVNEVKNDIDPFSLSVSKNNFIQHLEMLKDNYSVIKLFELVEQLKNKEVSDKSVVITFDDGYIDNYTIVKPLLEKYKIPATFFITSAGSSGYFWWDILVYFVINTKQNQFKLGEKEFRIPALSSEKYLLIRKIHSYLRILNFNDRILFINDIYKLKDHSGINKSLGSMTNDQIKELSASEFVEIGGHTKNHIPLSDLKKEYQHIEVSENKILLENTTQNKIDMFAYPHGQKTDYDLSAVQVLKKNSFTCGLTAVEGVVHNSSDPLQLPRIWVDNIDVDRFKKIIEKWL